MIVWSDYRTLVIIYNSYPNKMGEGDQVFEDKRQRNQGPEFRVRILKTACHSPA
jgi:hypothetical protein